MVDAVAEAAAAAADDVVVAAEAVADSRKTDNQPPDWEEDLGDESNDGNHDAARRYESMERRN